LWRRGKKLRFPYIVRRKISRSASGRRFLLLDLRGDPHQAAERGLNIDRSWIEAAQRIPLREIHREARLTSALAAWPQSYTVTARTDDRGAAHPSSARSQGALTLARIEAGAGHARALKKADRRSAQTATGGFIPGP
jgi:hypothetical protein